MHTCIMHDVFWKYSRKAVRSDAPLSGPLHHLARGLQQPQRVRRRLDELRALTVLPQGSEALLRCRERGARRRRRPFKHGSRNATHRISEADAADGALAATAVQATAQLTRLTRHRKALGHGQARDQLAEQSGGTRGRQRSGEQPKQRAGGAEGGGRVAQLHVLGAAGEALEQRWQLRRKPASQPSGGAVVEGEQEHKRVAHSAGEDGVSESVQQQQQQLRAAALLARVRANKPQTEMHRDKRPASSSAAWGWPPGRGALCSDS
mmetsp:Transcript_35661/g.104364  ORF Transcript_35661/g.104364 Transcript_35661/m.104364 type:complete len:264 (-) Transcript_35661:40-831(-)